MLELFININFERLATALSEYPKNIIKEGICQTVE